MDTLPDTITLKDGTTANVSPMYHFFQAKRELDALKEKHPEVAERLFAEDKSDDEGDKGDEYYETEDLLEEAYYELWWVAELALQKGVTVRDWQIIKRHATSYNLKWDGRSFVTVEG